MFLLDTMVVSELRKSRPSPRLVEWMKRLHPNDLYLSVVTLGEIERGIARTSDDVLKQQLHLWLDLTIHTFADRILDVTPSIARQWGRWSAELGHEGADLFIAGTARVHGLTVVTRNVRHFKPTGVATIDPFV